MGRRRLIVQADLTSEEDIEFVAWVKEQRKRRKLGEQIREGLRLQYERVCGGVQPVRGGPVHLAAGAGMPLAIAGPPTDRPNAASKLQKLVGSL